MTHDGILDILATIVEAQIVHEIAAFRSTARDAYGAPSHGLCELRGNGTGSPRGARYQYGIARRGVGSNDQPPGRCLPRMGQDGKLVRVGHFALGTRMPDQIRISYGAARPAPCSHDDIACPEKL
ncbi:MAG TPA: hypothetical protein VF463_04175 [Sphingobium sp.]